MTTETQGTETKRLPENYELLSPYGKMMARLSQRFSRKSTGRKRKKMVNYSKYGYLFLLPFFVAFLIFQLVPLFQTFYYSFFEYYQRGLNTVGPTFNGWANYSKIFGDPMTWKYFGNTMLMWIIGFVPQIIISLLLAIWFTDSRLKLKGARFFKTVTYMPNLVMAAAFGQLFLMLFSQNGPINQIFHTNVLFTDSAWWSRCIIAFIDWLMWFGNTSILLMSGVMGIDESVFESARLDGSSAHKTFWRITMPLLMPIIVYVLITSLIGGIQLFDVVQIFTQGGANGPASSTETIMMFLYNEITKAKDYGLAGTLSVLLFLITAVLSIIIYKGLVPSDNAVKQEARARKKRARKYGALTLEQLESQEGGKR
jgi:multiple sugar transport system permease protein